MSTVAFLSSIVDPRVASAAAKAAIGKHPCRILSCDSKNNLITYLLVYFSLKGIKENLICLEIKETLWFTPYSSSYLVKLFLYTTLLFFNARLSMMFKN